MKNKGDKAISDSSKLLISACLLGEKVKYDGGDNYIHSEALSSLAAEKRLVSMCPELFAGFSVPRPPVEISGPGGGEGVLSGTAKVLRKNGEDLSSAFIDEAQKSLELAQKSGVQIALFKQRSPSCGVGQIYDGSFSGKVTSGDGVTTAFLKQNGILVFSDEELEKALSHLSAL